MTVVTSIWAGARAMGLGFTTLDFGMLVKPVLEVVVMPGAAMLAGPLPFFSDCKRTAVAY
jgi:hypothetical protein